MLILAIDTALDACSAAVLDTHASKMIATESQSMKRGHAEALMPLIGRVMKESGLPFAALDRVAVTTGPGSFTGLRVGLSAARGIGLAAGKPVVGLTTLSAYAAPIVSENGEHPILAPMRMDEPKNEAMPLSYKGMDRFVKAIKDGKVGDWTPEEFGFAEAQIFGELALEHIAVVHFPREAGFEEEIRQLEALGIRWTITPE